MNHKHRVGMSLIMTVSDDEDDTVNDGAVSSDDEMEMVGVKSAVTLDGIEDPSASGLWPLRPEAGANTHTRH